MELSPSSPLQLLLVRDPSQPSENDAESLAHRLKAIGLEVVPLSTESADQVRKALSNGQPWRIVISAMKREIRRAQSRRRLQEDLRIRDEFLTIASHELKTPLTPLKLRIQALRRLLSQGQWTPGPTASIETLSRMLDTSDQQIDRLTRLVEDLLDATRMHSGNLQLSLENLDLSEMLMTMMERHEEQFSSAGCKLVLFIPPSVRLRCDRSRIEQLISNLLSNAVKFGKRKPIHVRLSSNGIQAELRVQDFGIGIPDEVQPRIFQQFKPVSAHAQYGGLGLGLFIARQIVRCHEGEIRVSSKVGEGSSFIVTLPLEGPARVPEAETPRDPKNGKASRKRGDRSAPPRKSR